MKSGNEFYKAFNDVYQYARQNMNLPAPIYGHHVENIVHYIDDEHPEMMQNLMHPDFVNDSPKLLYRFC